VTAPKISVVALIALLICSMSLAAPAGANVDQCAPPGVQSASALPTNLAKAAAGPGADRYTTATVEPLTAVNGNALGLSMPGTLTVGTLSDAPPSICINSAGQFTGFDNELLRAIADKLGLRINFVGTEFSGLLAQVASRRFDVGSSSITTTDARRKFRNPSNLSPMHTRLAGVSQQDVTARFSLTCPNPQIQPTGAALRPAGLQARR
jgi:polar amino acid transport system substrate-binding protein